MYEHVLYMNVNTLSHPLRDIKRVMLESMMYEHAHPVVSKAERVVVAIYDCINFGKRVFTVFLLFGCKFSGKELFSTYLRLSGGQKAAKNRSLPWTLAILPKFFDFRTRAIVYAFSFISFA